MNDKEIEKEIANRVKEELRIKEQQETSETVKEMEGTVKEIQSSLKDMVIQLKSIEKILIETLNKVDNHIDIKNHDKMVREMFKRMTPRDKLDFHREMTECKEVKEARKEEILEEMKDVRNSLSWKAILGISSVVTLILTTILVTLTKFGLK